MNDELSQPDITKLLERMAPPETPDDSFANANGALNEVRSWHRRNAALGLAGLQTEPAYHANDIRLDWLQRLVLSKAEGKKKPAPKDFQRILNHALDVAKVLRLEDPIEDTFCDLVTTSAGNFRILLGRWEAAAAYTQTVFDAFEDLPASDQKASALEAAYALLKLSDEICERAGIDRGVTSGGSQMDAIRLPSKERLNDLARRVRFKRSHLERLAIDSGVLQQFYLQERFFPFVSDRAIGDTPLEFCPLLAEESGFAVISPTNLSLAVRAVLIEAAVEGGMGLALQRRLLERQERFSEATGFWPTGSIRLSAPNKHNLRASVCKYDHGRYLHVIQIPTLFDGLPERGFGTLRRLPAETNEFIAADIERFWQFVEQEGDCRSSATVLLLSGWGAPHAVAPPIKADKVPAHWQFVPLSFADAAVLGACDNGKLRDILRLTEQADRLEQAGFSTTNPNGLLNLFGFWRMTDGNLVPEHMWETVPPMNLMLGVDDLLKPRLEALQRQDRRALPLPEGGHKVVQRKDWGYDDLDPIYASPEDVAHGRLAGAVAFGGRTVWIESEAREGVSRTWQYQVWNAILEWLGIVGPRLAEGPAASLFGEGAHRVSIVLPKDDGAIGIITGTVPQRSLSESIEVRRDAGSRLAVVEIGEDWADHLRDVENRAEAELVAAVLEGIADANHKDFSRAAIVSHVRAAIGSSDWRWLHAFEADDPMPRLAALGVVEGFKPISFSAHALIKCGSVWTFRDRSLGGKIEGEEACREFLKEYRDSLLASLIADIRRFDRKSLVTAAARSFHAARHEQHLWRSTIRAMRAIRGPAADTNAFDRQNKVNAVIRASKSICEIAACEAAPEGGLSPARAEIDEMFAKALLLFGNGQLFAAIRAGLVPASLRVSPGGDVLSEREIFSRLLEPGANWLHSRVLDRAHENYGSTVEAESPPERLGWPDGLRAAVEAEYGTTAEAYVDFQFAMVQLAENKGQDVFVARHSELKEALEKNAAYPGGDTGALLKRLTLNCRTSWHADLSEAEIDLSRFDRRFSLINRPLAAIDGADDPAVVVAPGLIVDSVTYCISGLHRGDLNNTFWESVEARRYAGARGDAVGHEFEEEVASKLNAIGLDAECGCKLSKLLNQKVSNELGNVDVFALTKDGKRAWVIEAKDLRLCRTEAEVASRLSEYRGLLTLDSKGREKPDKLLRHLRRVEFLRAHTAALAKTLKLDTPPEVKGLLVVDCPQPMNFHMLEDVPDAVSVFLDAIGEFAF